ncbi:NAD-dependent epimerase/dehydratase family protein [Ruminiclostridium cellulolyticum]|uniref:NAD-dependent epimerase/dehydratase n=1 Tax=Ruminiclostridium cellulolyticum (strain ATCC 35319 / DSM 5812 / JCM 6584 / H10) TaxID=394503 RepID=B8I7M9_RUMCH|nr:NAD-dependent epimerase/dehydratase family protein [Ruminiclostridium cellulolyticum]ACL77100.1 NAD-dependent epimerase/dehydratase [Ruminiclostridium cellulolyticum H10]
MKYLITGGNGFIGSHLTLRLLIEGHKVTVLDNFFTSPKGRLSNTGANVIEGSVNDENLINSLIENCDHVIHLASIVGVRLAMLYGIDGLKLSCQGTENILKHASRLNKKVLVTSSSAIYGKIVSSPVNEEADSLIGCSSKSSWLYSISKLAEEHMCLAYYREHSTKVKICRLFNVIGPNQSKHYGMVVPNFISCALKNEPIQVYGDGTHTRTFSYVDDIIDGIEIIIENGKDGEVYNIGGTEEISILELAKRIINLTNSSSAVEFVPFSKVFGDNFEETRQRKPDISKLCNLGYNPKYSLDEALLKIISVIKQRGDI